MTQVARKPEPTAEITKEQLEHLLEVIQEGDTEIAIAWLKRAITLSERQDRD
jgi:hypothetical protein